MLEKFYALCAKIPQDKLLHYVTLQLLAAVLLIVLPVHGLMILLTALLCAAAAVLKEIRDLKDPHHKADPWDVVAGLLGGVPLYLLYWAKLP